MLTAGLGGTNGHGCVSLSDGGRILAVCEQERVTRVRSAGFNRSTGLPDEALDTLLDRRNLTRESVGKYLAAEPLPAATVPPHDAIDHHLAHAATAYFTSPYASAAILVCDADAPGLSLWQGDRGQIKRIDWPWSGPGLTDLYSRCSEVFGLRTPGGQQRFEAIARLAPDARDDRLAQLFATDGHSLITDPRWQSVVEDRLVKEDGRLAIPANAHAAAALQRRIGELAIAVLKMARQQTSSPNLCLGGTLFFHSSINTLIEQAGVFTNVFVPIDPGNAGLAVGTALCEGKTAPGTVSPFLGPAYSRDEVKATLDNCKLHYSWESEDAVIAEGVKALRQGLLVGWFEAEMEWGPRALGSRSIVASPSSPYVLENLNRFLKRREPWRGYALVGEEDAVREYFDGPAAAPYMEHDYRPRDPEQFATALPAPTAAVRVQTVNDQTPPRFRRLLQAFGDANGLPFLINTSFNAFREPIVCSPRDAVRVYYGSGLDLLIAEQFVLAK
jgi:carbamoyltransferase